ncbi:transposase [Shewanella aestuarii]|uniref:transposase n=1 Tax=Shewanella aestuarii TaxID=1028752 RepID=UPI00329801DC
MRPETYASLSDNYLEKRCLTRQGKSSALWSRSYFACTAGGATIETLKAYVESQSTPE